MNKPEFSRNAKAPFEKRYGNFIGGKWVEPRSGRYFENFSPVNGQVLCEIARSNEQDIEAALDAEMAGSLAGNATVKFIVSGIKKHWWQPLDAHLAKIASNVAKSTGPLSSAKSTESGEGTRYGKRPHRSPNKHAKPGRKPSQ